MKVDVSLCPPGSVVYVESFLHSFPIAMKILTIISEKLKLINDTFNAINWGLRFIMCLFIAY